MPNPIFYICNKWHLWTRDRSTLMNYLSYSTRPWQNLFLAFHFRSSFCHLFSAQLDESNYLNLSYIIPYYPSYINFQPKSQAYSKTCKTFFHISSTQTRTVANQSDLRFSFSLVRSQSRHSLLRDRILWRDNGVSDNRGFDFKPHHYDCQSNKYKRRMLHQKGPKSWCYLFSDLIEATKEVHSITNETKSSLDYQWKIICRCYF